VQLRSVEGPAITARNALRLAEVALLVLVLLVLWVVLFRSAIGPMLRSLLDVGPSAYLALPPPWLACGSQLLVDVAWWVGLSLLFALVVGLIGHYFTKLDAADERAIDTPTGRVRTLAGRAVQRVVAKRAQGAARPHTHPGETQGPEDMSSAERVD
jgi:hypothetical protein